MENTKYSISKRTIAVLLSIIMVFTMLPAINTAAAMVQEDSQVADNQTMDSWKTFFSPTDITTAHAGGVWTDKSVFTSSPFNSPDIAVDKENQFLVALSALGSNSVVVGQTYSPTDTMFVLDVSNSMSDTALSNMVDATNSAIRILMAGEGNTNRVGVVLFGTDADVLLPLDHYSGVQINGMETFLQISGNNIRTARTGNGGNTRHIQKGVGSNAQNYSNSAGTGGGTYAQGGIWAAWQQFNAATVDTAAQNKRVPTLVLMCDGAATYAAADYDAVPASASHGTGSASSTANGFVTQLTAAYVKAKMAAKYGVTKAYLYTLGLEVEDIDIAQAVLDPSNKTAATDIDEAWNTFLTQDSVTLNMFDRDEGWWGDYVDVDIANDSEVEFTAESYKYADRYFNASQSSDLIQQFQNIVNEINLSAGYYPTHLDDNGSNYSGYVTFVDELGKGMVVKEVEGIVMGDHVYTGELLAESLKDGDFGTRAEPTAMGDEFVRAMKARLGITDTQEVWDLLKYAWDHDYLHYTDTDDWSNYIVWYGNANGDYLGYEESLMNTATYRNACYGMLGTADESHKVSDMMYVGIQVSTNLITGDQMVTFRVPASMLPVVTYQININGDEVVPGTTASLTYNGAEPIRLVYEVGVKDGVNELNVTDYATKVGDQYYLYTSKWEYDAAHMEDMTANNLSYTYFEPGADNEHYYFTEDAVIYTDADKTGTVSSAAALDVNGTYYYEHYVFNDATVNPDGTFVVNADFHVEQLSKEALETAKSEAVMVDGKLCVPKGTMHYAHSHNLYKGAADSSADHATANITETFDFARYQIVDAALNSQSSSTGAKHYELMYLGNNGRLEVQPATGISITKRVDDTITDANATYTFEITFTGVADGTYNGVQVSGNKATVSLRADETVYIYNLPVGATYEIAEKYGDGYRQSAADGASGMVVGDTIQAATFTNTKRGTGSLVIEKDVINHPFATAEIERVDFNFAVELTKADGSKYSGDVSVIKSGDAAATTLNFVDGMATFTLHDNQALTIVSLPEGTTYTVYEVDSSENAVAINGTPRSGYQLVSVAGQTTENTATGEITANTAKYAHFVNAYKAQVVAPAFEVDLTKYIETDQVTMTGVTYQFLVEQVKRDGTQIRKWEPTITLQNNTFEGATTAKLEGLQFDTVGNYYFRITEVTPAENEKLGGMTYDSKRAAFTVAVKDTNQDGVLEVAVAESADMYVNMDKVPYWDSGRNSYVITASFTNVYHVGSTTADFYIHKKLENETGIEIPLTNFHFALYKNEDLSELAFSDTDANNRAQFTAGPAGDAEVKIHITEDMVTLDSEQRGELTYWLREIPGSKVGMNYDRTLYKVVIPVTKNGANLQAGTPVITTVQGNSTVSAEKPTTAVFNNKYEAQAVNVTLSGEKTLDGRDWHNGEKFIAELYETDATFHYSGNPKQTAEMLKEQVYSLNVGDFAKVGIYHYVVKEKNGGQTENGITYDATEYHVTVTITLDETVTTAAKLKADVTVVKLGNGAVEETALDFNNVYNYTPIDTTLSGVKKVVNETPNNSNSSLPTISPKGYQFMLRKNNNAGEILETVTSGADGSFTFQPLHFTAPGEYVYEIVEVGVGETKVNGVAYDAANWNVTVVVEDDGSGALYVASTETNRGSNIFTNTYTADAAILGLTGIKDLVGAEGTDRPLQENDFSFTLKPVGDAPMPNNQTSVTVKNDAEDKFTFPDISFNAVGAYQYTITEEKETDGTDGIYYDKAVYTVTVDVTDNGAGKLSARITNIVANKGLANETTKHIIDFYNSYHAAPVEVILSGNKALENVTPGVDVSQKDIPLTGENLVKFPFSFVIEAVTEDAPMPGQTTVSSGENGAITFGAITFSAVGEYKYTVKEVIPADSTNGVLNSVTYTAQTHNITITVTDNKLGQLVASVALNGNDKTFEADGKTAKVLSFRNTYSAAAEAVTLGGSKVLENVTPGIAAGTTIDLTGNEFIFKLEAVTNGAPMPAGTGNVTKNAAGGAFRFGQITFDALGEYRYTITEISDPAKGYITYAQPVGVTVKVTDADVDGKLEAAVTYGNTNNLSVTNRYKAEGTKLIITGSKKVDTRNPRNGEFSFTLTGVNGAPMSSAAVNNQVTVKNDASGKITFPEITYDTVGVYKYTIEEVKAADGTLGVTYDKAVYDITVTVSDGGEGKLLAVAKSVKRGETANSDVTFFNKYQAAPVSVSFAGTKILAGRQLQDGEFSFILTDEAGATIETVKNQNGKITFADQKLLATGTYKFFIEEDITAKKDGIDYDETVYEVTVEVKDDGLGQLKAYIGGVEKQTVSFSFENTFTPKETVTQITVEKQLQNLCDVPMGLEGFKFQVEDAAGQKTVGTSDADGIAKFAFTFNAEDAGKTYVYKLTEVNTKVKGIQYSTAEYEVKIAVMKDAATGELSTAVSITNGDKAHAGNPVFVNYYDLGVTPETGDETRLLEMGLCMGISGIGLLAVLILGRKKKECSAE